MARASKRKPEVEKDERKILSHDEHIKVQISPLQVQNAKLLMALEEQSLANMILELKLLEQKIQKQKEKVEILHSKYESEKVRHEAIVGQIMKNHGLNEDNFSYNSETGEIIL